MENWGVTKIETDLKMRAVRFFGIRRRGRPWPMGIRDEIHNERGKTMATKSANATDPNSCWGRALDGEEVFVLLARDPAAPATIRAWMAERVRIGKNTAGDGLMREAAETARRMDEQRDTLRDSRRNDPDRCTKHTPPGYDTCTRPAGHDGPCALPFAGETGAAARSAAISAALDAEPVPKRVAGADAEKTRRAQVIAEWSDGWQAALRGGGRPIPPDAGDAYRDGFRTGREMRHTSVEDAEAFADRAGLGNGN